MTLDQLSLELLGLPAKARASLAEKLLASLEDDMSQEVDHLWAAEAERRAREIDEGTVSCRAAEDVIRDIRSRLK